MSSEQSSVCFNLSGYSRSGPEVTVAVGPGLPQAYTIPPVYYDHEDLFVAVHRSHMRASPHEDFVYVLAHGFPSLVNTPQTSTSPDTLVGKSGAAKPRSSRATIACTNCRSAGKKCSDARPCTRCCQRNMDQSCCDEIPRVRGRKRMRKEQNSVTVMPEASSQLPAEPDYLNLSTWTTGVAQVATGEHEQHTQASLETFGSLWQPQYPSASSSHITPTWDPALFQNTFPGGNMGYCDAPAAGINEHSATPVTLNQVKAYPAASLQSFSNPSLNILG